MKAIFCSAALAAACSFGTPARAESEVSAASAISALPIAVSITLPAALLSQGAALSVVAVEASTDGIVWVVDRAADGARASLRLGAPAAGAVSVGVGTALVVSAVSTGWVLSTAGRAVCFVPNATGQALLFSQRVSR